MATWAQIEKLPEDYLHQIQSLYNEHFPLVVRSVLAKWIESQQWSKIEYDNPDHANFATSLVAAFIQQLNCMAQKVENNLLKYTLEQLAIKYQNNYLQDPLNLVRIVNFCLNNELEILQHAKNTLATMDIKPVIQSSCRELTPELDFLRAEIEENDTILCKLNQDQEQLDQLFLGHHDNLNKTRNVLVERLQETTHKLSIFESRLLNIELEKWRRGQQLAGNGVVYEGYSLDDIQKWCEGLAELICITKNQIIRMQRLCQSFNQHTQYINDTLYAIHDQVTKLLHRLVKNTFVIEKQPPQVMKTNTRFTSVARLLVGGKLNIQMSLPTVRVFIISEHQASIMTSDSNSIISQNESAAGEIQNNTASMEYNSGSSQLTVHFRNMQLKKIKRTEKKGTESVMDEKFALLFYSRFTIFGSEHIEIQTFSLPVVVIVHGNQEPPAHATIIWDNAFAEPNRTFFEVPDKVPFIRVGEVLSKKFIAHVGRGLSEDNLRFLAAKALRTPNVPDLNAPISWSQFSKEPLPQRNFTFWEWFYAILKVTKEHLRNFWNDNTIIGFIWKKQVEEMLASCQSGTFLLRFSDSELGGLTVAWKSKSPDGSTDQYYMLQPFVSKDFTIRGLADRLNDLKCLTYLYPDTPKNAAFSKYYTPIMENIKSKKGYVKPVLMTFVPSMASSQYDCFPGTPQSSMYSVQHSPSDSNSMHYDNSSSSHLDSNCNQANRQNGLNMLHQQTIDMMECLPCPSNQVPVDLGYQY